MTAASTSPLFASLRLLSSLCDPSHFIEISASLLDALLPGTPFANASRRRDAFSERISRDLSGFLGRFLPHSK
ncbi:MAG: hypothetical protein D6795_06480 [Deltaproteobacteria bacterium]|nr:MAG: hypothetical protein D6795_06480 [Deltaproteobacteria bacterium]